MKVAIIGGGASGMATAYYLSQQNEVVLFEKQDYLGGNICTLGKNVSCANIPEDLVIDNGVIEFLAYKSPMLTALLESLGVKTRLISTGSSGLFLNSGRSYHMLGAIRRSHGIIKCFKCYLNLLSISIYLPTKIYHYCRRTTHSSLGELLGEDALSKWLRMLTMYGFSLPYKDIDQMPMALSVSAFTSSGPGAWWKSIEGGTYSYIEAIIAQAHFDIHLGVEGLHAKRCETGITLIGGPLLESTHFDAVVFATPPHCILDILEDASPEELRVFSSWKANYIETIIHTDESIYNTWSPPEYTEFDLFEKEDENTGAADAGYNSYLNRLIGLSDKSDVHYFLGFNLDDRIDPKKILHRQGHETTYFSAIHDTADILKLSGSRRIYFAGAYLFDGLHEGAIESAVTVSKMINQLNSTDKTDKAHDKTAEKVVDHGDAE